MHRRQLLIGSTVVGIAALGGSARAQSSDAEAVKATNEAFYGALSARDIKAMGSVWANRPYVVNIGPRSKTVLVGYAEAVTKYWSGAFDFFSQMQAAATSIAQLHTDGKIGWIVGTESANLQPKTGGEPLKFDTFVTNIFEKDHDRWLMISHHAQVIPK